MGQSSKVKIQRDQEDPVYMWFELPQKRLPGAVALGLGSLICGLFCVGLRWLF
jgi:hypothetical protein